MRVEDEQREDGAPETVVFSLFVDESQSQEASGTGLIKAQSEGQIPGLGPDSGRWESLECRWERKGISTVSIVRPLPQSVRVWTWLISGSKWKRSDCDGPASPHVQIPLHR
ncbi:hypothetical protein QQF64_008867 [Cirrhinus molitorella]|uniref:Uncharacterized protein n=1 Tax=Cirrhinus molitorella TaxID=172907 RepID=A0ABR3M8T6_9TELE